MDLIVIGGGVMGCAASYAMASRGHRVRLLERHHIGHPFGSSHGPSRIIRLSYGHAEYIPLARRSFEYWRALEAEAATPLLTVTAGIDVAGAGVSLEATVSAMTEAAVPFSQWDSAQIRYAYPQFRFPEGTHAVFQADTAVLNAENCVAALADLAIRSGAEIERDMQVLDIRPSASGVSVDTNRGRYEADCAIICAGSEMPIFLRRLGLQVPLKISKEQAIYLTARTPAEFAPGKFPVCIRHFDAPVLSSIFPIVGGTAVKMMIEQKTQVPDLEDFAVDEAQAAIVRAQALHLMPGLSGEVERVDTCRYTLTEDEHFLIDRHPEHSQVLICSACSGHGFKFAPVVGEMLADLAEGAGPPHPLFRFDPKRFDSTGAMS